MSGNATGSGADTKSSVNANRNPNTGGEEASASNVSSAGGGYVGPAKHTAGAHDKDWKNIMDPRYDANNNTEKVRAEAHAQAKAEAEREKHAETERVRAEERGDAEAQHTHELERAEAEKRSEAAQARADGRAEAEREAQAAATRAEEEKSQAVDAARRDARAQAEAEADERRRAEEAERQAKTGGVRDAVKGIAKTAHGAGESLRGRFNAKVDDRFGDHDAAAEHRNTAKAGEHKIGQTQA